jgi:hypothetical protein
MQFNIQDHLPQLNVNMKVDRYKKQHYLAGLLQNNQIPGHEVKLRNFNLNGIAILPNVAYSRNAVEVSKHEGEIKKVPMFRFFLKENYSETDWMDFYAKWDMFERQGKDIKLLEKQEISLFQLFNFNKKLNLEAYWIGQLLSNNGKFSVDKSNQLLTDKYSFEQNLNVLPNIDEEEFNRNTLAEFIMKAREKTDVDTILLGTTAANKYFANATINFVSANAPVNLITPFDTLHYTPVGYGSSTIAKGVTLIDKIIGCNVLSVSGSVDLLNGSKNSTSNVVSIFEPTTVTAIDSNNLGVRYTGTTERIENGTRIIDDSEMSFYTINSGEASDKNITFKSEGNMLIALKNPENISTLKIIVS